jgi:adenosylhomocysteine nucleosidase
MSGRAELWPAATVQRHLPQHRRNLVNHDEISSHAARSIPALAVFDMEIAGATGGTSGQPFARSTLLSLVFAALFVSMLLLISASKSNAAEMLDTTPRTAVISAFEPEWTALQGMLQNRRDYVVNAIRFGTGTINGKPVVLFLSGISMVNAATATQLALDHFTISRIVYSGIAGGADPDLKIGDVVVPDAWCQYLEAVFAREKKDGTYLLPSYADKSLANFGMIFPQPVEIARENQEPEKKIWFPVDTQLLAVARGVSATTLKICTVDNKCLAHKPKIVVGGKGVSGEAFVDNEAFREYARKTFDAEALDMETAAVAHVAYTNKTPFIAFRSVSDLAGGGEGENEIGTFFQLASDNSATVVKAFLGALPQSYSTAPPGN